MMQKVAIVLALALVAGVSFFIGRSTIEESNAAPTPRYAEALIVDEQLETKPSLLSAADAADLRKTHYATLTSIEKILELPTDYAQTEALYTLAGRANETKLKALIVEAMSIVSVPDRTAALHVLFSRYSELDPNAAVDYMLFIDLDISPRVLPVVFDAWAKTDLNAAIAKANQLVNLRERQSASKAILLATARTNDSLVDQVADSLLSSEDAEYVRGIGISDRAKTDPLGALRQALSLNVVSSRYSALYKIADVWAANDPAGALESSDLIKDMSMREQFVSGTVERWILDDATQAMQYIQSHPDARARELMLKRALGVYAQVNPEDALTLALQATGETRITGLQQVMAAWASSDPQSTMLAINSLDNAVERNQLIQAVGRRLSADGTDKALQWLDSLDFETRSGQMRTVVTEIAAHQPRRALEYALANAAEADLGEIMVSVLFTASRSDPEIVQDYISQLPAGAKTDILYRQVAANLAANDSEATLRLIDGLTGVSKENAIRGAASTFARTDPDSASLLINQLPEAAVPSLLRDVSRNMSRTDPTSALAWLEQFSGRPGYDGAVVTVIEATARRDPRSAAVLASQATPSVRDAAVASVAAAWSRSNSRQATDWVLSLPAGVGKDQALGNLVASVPADVLALSRVVSSISSATSRDYAITHAFARLVAAHDTRQAANVFLDEVGAGSELRFQLQGAGSQ